MDSNWSTDLKNIKLTPTMLAQLAQYYQLLVANNAKMNLTTIIAEQDVYYKHFYDALLISNDMILTTQSICDVGSGAGIPGLVLKICFPQLAVTIIEANAKKCAFLQTVVTTLGLQNITITNGRIEQLTPQLRESFDIVTARAVAPLNILVELCLALVKVKGLFIAYKGLKVAPELLLARKGITLMGAIVKAQLTYQLPQNYGTRVLLHLQKVKLTPLSYPRSYQHIKHKPL